MTFEPDDGYLFSAKWSPVRAAVLGAVSERGHLLLYDLKGGHMVPKHRLDASPNRVPVYTMQFNHRQ